jgi:DNA repair exonuclease SbcCD ATPase subunit
MTHETQSTVKQVAVAVALAVSLGGNAYLLHEVRGIQADVGGYRQETAQLFQGAQERSAAAAGETARTIQTLEEELTSAREQASKAAGTARSQAQKHADALAQKLAAEQQKHAEQMALVAEEMRQNAGEAKERFEQVDAEVTTVRTDVATTRTDLESTIADLKQVRGDMGVMSDHIATNSTELGALKELGDRNYFEFTMDKSSKPQNLAGVMVALRKADAKKNRFTLDLTVDDKQIQKKDKTALEPVQFYASGYRQPFELVVFEVSKNQIKGYLSAPKVQVAEARGPAMK